MNTKDYKAATEALNQFCDLVRFERTSRFINKIEKESGLLDIKVHDVNYDKRHKMMHVQFTMTPIKPPLFINIAYA
ncbi:MAG: hypothetical protein IMY67_11145 [Bacteroidetes bacterium]|nr:hypothetical protein [Bacteroidota bacterium]